MAAAVEDRHGVGRGQAQDPREVLGMGSAAKLDWLEIKWPQPSGRVERFGDLPTDRYIAIVEGKGISGA